MLKDLKIQKAEKIIPKNQSLPWKQYLYIKTLKLHNYINYEQFPLCLMKIHTHNYINYEQFPLCLMKIHHAVSEKSNDKLFFLITEDKMSLRTSTLAILFKISYIYKIF